MKVESYKRTCLACPSQWEGILVGGDHVYMRYRWGEFGFGVGKNIDEAVRKCEYVETKGNDDDWGGFLSDSELKVIMTRHGFDMSEAKLLNEPIDSLDF